MNGTSPGRPAWSLRGLYLAIGLSTAAVVPFLAVILDDRGVDTVTIGALAGLASLVAAVLVPAWGHLADVVVGRAAAFRIGVLIAAAAAIVLLLDVPIPVFAVTMATFAIYPTLFLGLGDALAVAGLPAPERQYGALRSLASLSFAVGVIVAGLVYDRAGYGAVPAVSLVASGAMFAMLGWVPDRTRDPSLRLRTDSRDEVAAAHRLGSIGHALATEPRLWGVLLALCVAYIGLLGAVIFVGIRIVDLGGQPSDVAFSWGIASFAEIPGLVIAGWAASRVGLRSLIVAALIVSGVCIAAWGILPSPIAINATRPVTGLLFGALTAARVVLVSRLLPVELQATGQALLQAGTFGLGTALGGLLGGVVYAGVGPVAFFGLAGTMVILGGIGAAVVLRGTLGARAGVAVPLSGPTGAAGGS
jgi:MFS transporter, PPP family, 3-phenylpropionic acid transporter